MFDDAKDPWVYPDPYTEDDVVAAAEDSSTSLGILIERLNGLDRNVDFDMEHGQTAIEDWIDDLTRYKEYVDLILKTAKGE